MNNSEPKDTLSPADLIAIDCRLAKWRREPELRAAAAEAAGSPGATRDRVRTRSRGGS
jgi:hypothetical protein